MHVLRVLAIRGATTVDRDEAALIRSGTRQLLEEIIARNGLRDDHVISAIFTVTEDLRSDFPARAAREMGWEDVPLLCTMEIPVPGGLERCIRVLLHVTSQRERSALQHVYLAGARSLRPDLHRD